MNPETGRLEPVTYDTPESWEEIRVGQHVQVFIYNNEEPILFQITKIEDHRVLMRVIEKSGPGRRWALKHIPYGTPVRIGNMEFIKAAATNRTLRLNPVG